MKVKICGITSKKDALDAIYLGADALGFIFYSKSPRFVTEDEYNEIAFDLPPFVSRVGVFVDETIEKVNDITSRCQLDYVQLHGNESPDFCLKCHAKVIKAISVKEKVDLESVSQYSGIVTSILLDSKVPDKVGGTGKIFDWGLAIIAKEYYIPLILSGGLCKENIVKAVQLVNPYAIDLCSGVESVPGTKDYQKLKEFFDIVKVI